MFVLCLFLLDRPASEILFFSSWVAFSLVMAAASIFALSRGEFGLCRRRTVIPLTSRRPVFRSPPPRSDCNPPFHTRPISSPNRPGVPRFLCRFPPQGNTFHVIYSMRPTRQVSLSLFFVAEASPFPRCGPLGSLYCNQGTLECSGSDLVCEITSLWVVTDDRFFRRYALTLKSRLSPGVSGSSILRFSSFVFQFLVSCLS